MNAQQTSVKLFIVCLLIALLAAWVYSGRKIFAEQSIECSVSWKFSGKTVDLTTNDAIPCIDSALVRTTWLGDTPFRFLTISTKKDVRLPAREFVAYVYNKDDIS